MGVAEPDIRIDVLGKILAGKDAGLFLKVIRSDDTGGYLILFSKDESPELHYDAWVENADHLREIFIECGWKILWVIDRDREPG